MPARKYRTDPAQLLAEGQEILGSTSDDKYRHKVEMVNLVLSGLTPSYLSSYCDSSKRMITLWVKIADEQGFEALKPKKPTGRPAKLTEKQMKEIRTVLEEDDPKKYGQNVWDGPSLSAYIEHQFPNFKQHQVVQKSSLYREDLREREIETSSIRDAKVDKNTCWRTRDPKTNLVCWALVDFSAEKSSERKGNSFIRA